jgi:hypothetical protein
MVSMRESDSEYEQAILDTIEEHGWFCTAVFDPDGKAPEFAYSVGFTETLGQPEFIVFGLPTEVANAILWDVFRALKAGRVPEDGQSWPDLVVGYDCVIRHVHPTQVTREHLNSAIWFWGDPAVRGEPLTAYQIVWPDRDGRFPWDPGCAQWVRDDQTPLYIPREH